MADEQDRWLDRATAEILLRGESPEAVDPAVRDRAARLAEALGALAAPPVPTSGELPGEAAALAAFRTARAERADVPEGTPAHPGRDTSAAPSDAGLVRVGPRGDGAGRARWSRPLRLGLAAALTVGMVGGVAVAAGTGVLTTPFEGPGPDPAATVSSATSSDGPPASPSPLDGVQGGAGPGRDGAEGGGEEADRDAGSGDRAAAGAGDGRPDLTASCREVRAGEQPEGARGRALKEAAGGASRVAPYCRSLLAQAGTSARDRVGARDAKENGQDREVTREQAPSRNGKGGKGGKSHKGSKSAKGTKGDRGGNGSEDGKGGKDGKTGKGGKGGKGDRDSREGEGGGKGGKGGKGDDDDRHRPLPPAGHRYAPHAPSAFAPSRQQRAAFPAHAVLTLAKPS
ncbi:hypothetical protein ACFXAS_15615 [Streptomyces sp. NPDC059459]|uniref:hypothetical protein n=1 Tax=Streptomyces sp. NPDC059459 TaxID=3346839 RepID=UPI0036902FD4